MKSSEGSHCVSNLSFISFQSPVPGKYMSFGPGLREILGMTSYLRGRENQAATIFLKAHFSSRYSGCVRDGEGGEKKGIRDTVFVGFALPRWGRVWLPREEEGVPGRAGSVACRDL